VRSHYNGARYGSAGKSALEVAYVNDGRQHDDTAREGSPPGGPPAGTPPDTEQRPLGALAVTGFLTVTILVLWFGMYFLNLVRS